MLLLLLIAITTAAITNEEDNSTLPTNCSWNSQEHTIIECNGTAMYVIASGLVNICKYDLKKY